MTDWPSWTQQAASGKEGSVGEWLAGYPKASVASASQLQYVFARAVLILSLR